MLDRRGVSWKGSSGWKGILVKICFYGVGAKHGKFNDFTY